MKTEMNFAGIGPKLALINLPYIILALAVLYTVPGFFNFEFLDNSFFKSLGFIWLALGIAFWLTSAFWFLRNFKPGKLITNGPFSLCRNPIYASVILFVIPSLGVIFHSGLIISIALVLFISFKISIHGEEVILSRTFGDAYEDYKSSVNQIFPIPHKRVRTTLH